MSRVNDEGRSSLSSRRSTISEDAAPNYARPLQELVAKKRMQSEMLNHVPSRLEDNPYFSISHCHVLKHGYLVAQYNHTGSLILAHVNRFVELTTILNASPLVHLNVCWPYVVSLHQNNKLQIINILQRTPSTYAQPETRKYNVKLFVLWRRSLLAFCPERIVRWDMDDFRKGPREDLYEDKNSPRSLYNIMANASGLIAGTNYVYLTATDLIQVWDVERVVLLMEGQSESTTSSFLDVVAVDNTVVTSSIHSVNIWTFSETFQKVEPIVIKNPPNTLVTAMFIDESNLIVGDNFGNVRLHDRKTSVLIYQVNESLPKPLLLFSDASDMQLLQLELSQRVNAIERLGRWIFCAFEDQSMRIYNINQSMSPPASFYTHPITKNNQTAAPRGFVIENGIICMRLRRKTLAKSQTTLSVVEMLKPEIVVWSPKLAGFSEFYENKESVSANNVTSSLSFSYKQLSRILSDFGASSKEDLTEFTSIVDKVQDVIDHADRLASLNVDVPFDLIQKLQVGLDHYEEFISKLVESGKLKRFLTSNRLRKELEAENVDLDARIVLCRSGLEVLENRERTPRRPQGPQPAGSPTPRIESGTRLAGVSRPQAQSSYDFIPSYEGLTFDDATSQATQLIQNPELQQFWLHAAGSSLYMDWSRFIEGLSRLIGSMISPQDDDLLQKLIGNSVGKIHQVQLDDFLKGFGPLRACLNNVKSLTSQTWFSLFLTKEESALLLQSQPNGTFLVRLSKSRQGSFVLAYKANNVINHILIKSCMPEGFRIREDTATWRLFPSLQDILVHYSSVLKYALNSQVVGQPWFQGDVNVEEAEHLLENKPPGTFLVRFSSTGSYALSFIIDEGNGPHVRHTRVVCNDATGIYSIPGQPHTFASISELVDYYRSTNVFVKALGDFDFRYSKALGDVDFRYAATPR